MIYMAGNESNSFENSDQVTRSTKSHISKVSSFTENQNKVNELQAIVN